jgi:hypothetical protein
VIYVANIDQVEASPVVEIAGRQVRVVELEGVHHVVPEQVFRLFFRVADTPPTVKEPLTVETSPKKKPVAPTPKKKTTASTERVAPATAPGGEMTTTEAVLQAIGEQPRTTAETIERACVILGVGPTPAEEWKKRLYANIDYNLRAGKLVRKTDAATQLTKIHLGGAQ